MGGIFISLTKEDTRLADALRTLSHEVLGDAVTVSYSTSKELGIGPKAGADWFGWIVDQVSGCDLALILVTPQSVQKPWILWEAGAVYGAAFAKGTTGKVRPLLYLVKENQLPSPFSNTTTQYQWGDSE